jgi:hypothetical protein
MEKITADSAKFSQMVTAAQNKKAQVSTRALAPKDLQAYIESAVQEPNRISVFIVQFQEATEKPASARRVLEGETAAEPVAVKAPNDNKIYVRPDAVFGIGLAIFLFFILYNGFMCLYGVYTPRSFPSKQFKFGREM